MKHEKYHSNAFWLNQMQGMEWMEYADSDSIHAYQMNSQYELFRIR